MIDLNELFPQFLYWDVTFLNNTVADYTEVGLIFLVLILVFGIFQKGLLSYLRVLSKKTKTDIDDTLIEIVHTLRPPFYLFLAFFLAAQTLTLSGVLEKILLVILVVWIVSQVVVAVQILIAYVIKKRIQADGDEVDEQTDSALGVINLLVKIALWVVALLFILSNFGVEITSLIAGLGVGGIAIAFALQNILGDLFSSFAIYFDKPFQVGDFIVVGDKKGTVEKIGIKTTRVRALQGEEIVFANTQLTSSQIQNFKKMEERRIVFAFGITYDTPTEKMKNITKMIQSIFDDIKPARLDRVHFHQFGDSALNYECVYFVTSPDYNTYMDINQGIHLGIKDAFEKEGIEMAFPTQTIHIQK